MWRSSSPIPRTPEYTCASQKTPAVTITVTAVMPELCGSACCDTAMTEVARINP